MRFPIANPELRSTGSVNGMLATHADALGRTQVIGTSSLLAPALKQFVSVTDMPWGAQGNAKRVTDAAITNGQATLSSVSAAFTTADVGKSVEVTAAGAAGANLSGTILSVAAGVATLSASASATVSGAVCVYGSNDTTAFQNAHNALSASGGGHLLVPANRRYMLGKVTPMSNVIVQAYGAVFYFANMGANTTGLVAQNASGDAAVTNWGLYGATIIGDSQFLVGNKTAVYVDVPGSTDVRVKDCTFIGLADSAVGLYVSRGWVIDNRMDTIGHAAGRNAINVQLDNTTGALASDVTVHGNVLTNIIPQAIHVGINNAGTMTGPSIRIAVTDNKIVGTANAAITFEVGSGGAGANGVVANNVIDSAGGGIMFGGGVTNTADLARWVIANNAINITATTSGQSGISLAGNDCIVVGNTIAAAGQTTAHGINVSHETQTVTATLDGTTAVLTAVSIPSAGQTQIPNGTQVSGTGIPVGSYLVSGAGTATWTISQATTTPGTITVTAQVAAQNHVIADNTIHMPAGTAGYGMNIGALAYSQVSGNTVYFDPGSASATTYCLSLTNSFYCSFVNNRLTNSPRWGITLVSCHDCDLTSNKVHNPNQNGVASNAINVATCTNIDFDFNRIWDDTGASKITLAISAAATSFNLRARGNRILGATTNPPLNSLASYSEVTGNILSAGLKLASQTAEAYPGSTVGFTNPHPYPVQMIISGGTVTVIAIATANSGGVNFFTTGLTSGAFLLNIGDVIKCTSSVNPTVFESMAA